MGLHLDPQTRAKACAAAPSARAKPVAATPPSASRGYARLNAARAETRRVIKPYSSLWRGVLDGYMSCGCGVGRAAAGLVWSRPYKAFQPLCSNVTPVSPLSPRPAPRFTLTFDCALIVILLQEAVRSRALAPRRVSRSRHAGSTVSAVLAPTRYRRASCPLLTPEALPTLL